MLKNNCSIFTVYKCEIYKIKMLMNLYILGNVNFTYLYKFTSVYY